MARAPPSRCSPCRAIAWRRSAPVGASGQHLRLRAVAGDGRAVEGIAFRAAGKKLGEALLRLRGAPVHLAGTLAVNRFGGRERAQIRVVDIVEATQ